MNPSSKWTHLKIYCKNVESDLVLHQLLMLLVWNLELVIEKLPEILKEALQFEPIEVTAKLVIEKTLFQPTDV